MPRLLFYPHSANHLTGDFEIDSQDFFDFRAAAEPSKDWVFVPLLQAGAVSEEDVDAGGGNTASDLFFDTFFFALLAQPRIPAWQWPTSAEHDLQSGLAPGGFVGAKTGRLTVTPTRFATLKISPTRDANLTIQ